MHFKCIDNGFKRICNVTQSIVKTLTMFNKCLRMDQKCFSTRWQLFPTDDPNAAQTLKTKDVSSRCNKADPHTVNTANSTMFTCNKYSIEHQNSATWRIWFCLINKEQFSATCIKTFAEQQPIPTGGRNTEKQLVMAWLFWQFAPKVATYQFINFSVIVFPRNNHSLE